jgi:hypothetical protein
MNSATPPIPAPAKGRRIQRWLAALGRRIAPGVQASDAQAIVGLAMFAIAFAAQLATILITWDVWTIRTSPIQPPNLPVAPLPEVGFEWIVLVSLLAALVNPPKGVLLHGVALLAALVFDQHRLEPQFFALWLLLWACVSPRGAWFTRWFLASMWLWAGLHKFLSPEWMGVTSWSISNRLEFDPHWHLWFAVAIAAFETAVGLAAIFTRRLAAVLCLVQHAGILLFLSPWAYDFNVSVWPWNAATGIVGAWLFSTAPATLIARLPRNAAQWAVVAAIFLVPATYYLGWINAHLAHILYSEHTPKAWATTGQGEFEQLHAWRNLTVPFPDSHRLFIHDFSLRASPGHKLYIQDPRRLVGDRFLLMTPDRRVVEIDRQRFCRADAANGELAGVICDSKQAAFELERRGAKLQREGTHSRLVVSASFDGVNLSERDGRLLAALPNIEALEICNAEISSAALQPLDVLFALEILDVEGSKMSGLDLARLPNRTGLKWLSLNRTNVTDPQLKSLARLPKLSHLFLAETAIGDDGLAHVAALAALEWVDVSKTRITPAGLSALIELKQLKVLNLEDTAIDDGAVPHLARLPQLETLQLRGTRVSPRGIAQLQQQLPGCRIAH